MKTTCFTWILVYNPPEHGYFMSVGETIFKSTRNLVLLIKCNQALIWEIVRVSLHWNWLSIDIFYNTFYWRTHFLGVSCSYAPTLLDCLAPLWVHTHITSIHVAIWLVYIKIYNIWLPLICSLIVDYLQNCVSYSCRWFQLCKSSFGFNISFYP